MIPGLHKNSDIVREMNMKEINDEYANVRKKELDIKQTRAGTIYAKEEIEEENPKGDDTVEEYDYESAKIDFEKGRAWCEKHKVVLPKTYNFNQVGHLLEKVTTADMLLKIAEIQKEEDELDAGKDAEGLRHRRSWEKGNIMDSPSLDENQDLGFFKVWLLISQLLGVISIALVSAWCGQYLGGFAWQTDPKLQFNHHPFFMVIGLIFCYGNALLVYRVFRNQRKRSLKLLHFGLHTLAFIFAIVALKAVFDSHNLASPPIPNLYSVHSWLGLTAIILFALQYFCGFLAFLFPGLTKIWRAKYLPLHVFFGLAIFIMVIAAALMGITEKLIFSAGAKYKELPPEAMVGNVLGYCLIMFALLVVYLVATPQFRRRLLPEEVQLQLDPQESTN